MILESAEGLLEHSIHQGLCIVCADNNICMNIRSASGYIKSWHLAIYPETGYIRIRHLRLTIKSATDSWNLLTQKSWDCWYSMMALLSLQFPAPFCPAYCLNQVESNLSSWSKRSIAPSSLCITFMTVVTLFTIAPVFILFI